MRSTKVKPSSKRTPSEPEEEEQNEEPKYESYGSGFSIDTSAIECDEDGNVIEQVNNQGYNSDDSEEYAQIERSSIPPPSEEQELIITSLPTHHIKVDSVAGCGKTTTVIHAALRYPDKKFVILMYNKRLKEESKRRILGLGLHNVEVQNFHSFFVKHYEGESFTDIGLAQTITRNQPPKTPFSFDHIIIDEAQDMKLIFFRALCKIINDNQVGEATPAPLIMILGDKFQNVYKFLGSDERFLLFAEQVFDNETIPKIRQATWMSVNLSISYRLTRQTAQFINRCTLGQDRIQTIKDGPLPKYVICNLFNSPGKLVKEAIKTYGYENIFIVSNSVKSVKSPLRHIANKMSKAGVPIFVPNSDEAEIDEKVIAGKLVFTTYNQTKGLERDCVFVFNIDEWNPHKGLDCPNAVYVAMTRAKKQLILLHSNKSNYANFFKRLEIPKYTDFKIIGKYEPGELKPSADPEATPVAQLIEYLSGDVIDKASTYFTTQDAMDGCPTLTIQTTIEENDLHEDVSDITGVMIPAYYEFITTGQIQIYIHMPVKARMLVREPTKVDVRTQAGIAKLLHMANVYISSDSGYVHKLAQITKYTWVTPEHLQQIEPRLRKHVGNTGNMFEFRVQTTNPILTKHLAGSIDCISMDRHGGYRVYEFKCVKALKKTHLIQLAIYAYLLETGIAAGKHPELDKTRPRKYMLVNLLSGKYYRLKSTLPELHSLVEFLVFRKFFLSSEKTDTQFMHEVHETIQEFQ
jgi:hypothetical protein